MRSIYSQHTLFPRDFSPEVHEERKALQKRYHHLASLIHPHLYPTHSTRAAWRAWREQQRPTTPRWDTWETWERQDERPVRGRVVSGIYGRVA